MNTTFSIDTGISEHTHSRRTMASVLQQLKAVLPQQLYRVRGDSVCGAYLQDAVNHQGTIVITGSGAFDEHGSKNDHDNGREWKDEPEEFRNQGFKTGPDVCDTPVMNETTLLGFYRSLRGDTQRDQPSPARPHPEGARADYRESCTAAENPESERFRKTVAVIKSVARAGIQVRREHGFYPGILMNGVILRDGEVVFLPPQVMTLVSTYQPEEVRDLNAALNVQNHDDPARFARTCGWLFYLCASAVAAGSRGSEARYSAKVRARLENPLDPPVLYVRSFLPRCPDHLAREIRMLMRGAGSLESLIRSLDKALRERETHAGIEADSVPLFRRTGVVLAADRTHRFLAARWKLIAVLAIVAAAGLYLLSDALFTGPSQDLTGMGPLQIVETYFQAVDRLDLDTVDELFARGAGKEIRRELASFYVMGKLGAFYSGEVQYDGADSDNPLLDITGLSVHIARDTEEADDTVRVVARYDRTVRTAETMDTEQFRETIYLHRQRDRWYITESVRRTIDSPDSENRP